MSSTRTATDKTVFRQERYSSSPAYETGLMGNHVAKRASMLTSAEDRALLYFLQQESHKEGGLELVAEEVLSMFPEKIGTPTMRKLNRKFSEHFDEDEIRQIKSEMPWRRNNDQFPLNGEPIEDSYLNSILPPREDEYLPPITHSDCPTSYPASEVYEACMLDASELAEHLKVLCLDPSINLHEDPDKLLQEIRRPHITGRRFKAADLWNFGGIMEALHSYRDAKILEAKERIVPTQISKQIFEDMEYALETKSLVIIEGLERIGKSVSAESFCAQNPGRALYIRLEYGTDEKTFFRAIARAIGVSSSSQLKAVELRVKIQDMLQHGHLMLVIDEAHFLWPQTQRSKTAPKRVDWVRTSVVDFGVPVVLISTPQWDAQCEHHEKFVGWNARQIRGRIALHRKLPTELSDEDLEAIAKHKLPYADKKSIQILRAVALAKEDYVAAIERIVKRATFFAMKNGKPRADAAEIREAVKELIPVSDSPTSMDDAKEPQFEHKGNRLEGSFKESCSSPARAMNHLGNTKKLKTRRSALEEGVTIQS